MEKKAFRESGQALLKELVDTARTRQADQLRDILIGYEQEILAMGVTALEALEHVQFHAGAVAHHQKKLNEAIASLTRVVAEELAPLRAVFGTPAPLAPPPATEAEPPAPAPADPWKDNPDLAPDDRCGD